MTILDDNTTDKNLILETLLKIKDDYPITFKGKGNGICSYFGLASAKYITSKFPLWPKYSGISNFPVKSGRTETSSRSAFYRYHKWSRCTQYGKDRWELLDFLIEQVKKDIENEQKSKN